MGYLIRLSQENRCESLLWIFKLANIKTGSNLQRIKCRKLTETDYGNLSALTGLAVNTLKVLSFEVVESSAAAKTDPNVKIPKHYVQSRKLKLCPKCLKDKMYYKKIWQMIFVTVSHPSMQINRHLLFV